MCASESKSEKDSWIGDSKPQTKKKSIAVIDLSLACASERDGRMGEERVKT